jgi:hypothetical protein
MKNYYAKEKKVTPSRNGISLSVVDWAKDKKAAAKVDEAIDHLKKEIIKSKELKD